MRKFLMSAATCVAMAMTSSAAKAQVDLSAYADAEGFLDVQTLTCAQLANTWQGDADRLATWYSGWYNGLAKKHYMDITKGKEAEHEVIVYCKANPGIKIIQAMEVVFKNARKSRHQGAIAGLDGAAEATALIPLPLRYRRTSDCSEIISEFSEKSGQSDLPLYPLCHAGPL